VVWDHGVAGSNPVLPTGETMKSATMADFVVFFPFVYRSVYRFQNNHFGRQKLALPQLPSGVGLYSSPLYAIFVFFISFNSNFKRGHN